MRPLSHEEIEKIALDLGASVAAMGKWKKRGVPKVWLKAIEREAELRKLSPSGSLSVRG